MILGKCLFCHKEFRKRERKYKFCSLACSSSFNKNGLISIDVPAETEYLAELMGIILGDGYVSRYQTSIVLNSIADREYIVYVTNLIKNIFPDLKISLIKRKNDKALDIRFSSRVISECFINMGIIAKNKSIPPWILENKDFKIACLRGLFDTEGSISFKIYKGKGKKSIYKQLNFRNKNEKIMLFVRDTLLSLGFKPTMSLRYSLYLSNDQSILAYRKIVGFNNLKLFSRSLITTLNEYEEYKKLA